MCLHGKVLEPTLLEWLQTIIEPQLMDTQCGVRKGLSMVDQISGSRESRVPKPCVSLFFVDLAKAYNLVDRTALVAILR